MPNIPNKNQNFMSRYLNKNNIKNNLIIKT